MISDLLKAKNNILPNMNVILNSIFQGPNEIVLEQLSETLKSQVKCIYIDPPYNNGEKHYLYTDKHSHEVWISGITSTLKKLFPLLSEDGSIWISIDDKEMHYLKVAADSVFGRKNFVSTIVWQQRTTRENRSTFSNNQEYMRIKG